MLKRPILSTCLIVLSFGITACESSIGTGPVRPDIAIPSINSSFVYDYEQRIVPVKSEDVDTTYKFELTATVGQHLRPADGKNDIITISLFDAEGFDMPHLRYKLTFDDQGNVYYNEPYLSTAWTKMAFATHESVMGPDTIIGNHSDYYQELQQKTTYLGSEQITIGEEVLDCEKIEWTRSLKETDQYSAQLGTQIERHIFWYSKKLGFFVARETDYTSSRLHKPKWKYTTKEKLKRYTLTF